MEISKEQRWCWDLFSTNSRIKSHSFLRSNIAIHTNVVKVPPDGIFYGKAWKYLSPHNCTLPSHSLKSDFGITRLWKYMGYENTKCPLTTYLFLEVLFTLILLPSQSLERGLASSLVGILSLGSWSRVEIVGFPPSLLIWSSSCFHCSDNRTSNSSWERLFSLIKSYVWNTTWKVLFWSFLLYEKTQSHHSGLVSKFYLN